MKKILHIFAILLGICFTYFHAFQTYALEESMKKQIEHKSGVDTVNSGKNTLAGVLKSLQSDFFVILMILAIGLFVYLGVKLLIARGNEEEYKKVMLGFAYAISGLAIIPLAYALVYFVSSINF